MPTLRHCLHLVIIGGLYTIDEGLCKSDAICTSHAAGKHSQGFPTSNCHAGFSTHTHGQEGLSQKGEELAAGAMWQQNLGNNRLVEALLQALALLWKTMFLCPGRHLQAKTED